MLASVRVCDMWTDVCTVASTLERKKDEAANNLNVPYFLHERNMCLE